MEQDTKPHFFFRGHTFKGLVTNRKKPMDSRRNKVCHLSSKARKMFVISCMEAETKDLLLLILITHKLCEIQMSGEEPMVLPCCSVLGRTRFQQPGSMQRWRPHFLHCCHSFQGYSLRVLNGSRAGTFQVCHVTWHQCSFRCT